MDEVAYIAPSARLFRRRNATAVDAGVGIAWLRGDMLPAPYTAAVWKREGLKIARLAPISLVRL